MGHDGGMTESLDEEVRRRFLRLAPAYVRMALVLLFGAVLVGAGASALVGGLFHLSLGLLVGVGGAALLLVLPAVRAHRRDD